MTTTLRTTCLSISLCAMGALSATVACAQSITFFELQGFAGRQMSADRSIPDFDPSGLNDAVNSIVVRDGQWQVCTDANYYGRCATLAPGEYPDLRAVDMSNSISSARRLDSVSANGVIPAPPIAPVPQDYSPPSQYAAPPAYAPPPPPRYEPPRYQPPRYQPPRPPYPGGQPPVVLYEEYDFGGASIAIDARVDNLDVTQWNDRAVSMVINEGNWELCTDAFHRGTCNVFGPGSYRDLGGNLVRQVSSMRRVDNGGRYPPPPPPPSSYAPPAYPSPAYAPPSYPAGPRSARAILYSDHDLQGGSLVIDGDLPNLDGSNFNDRASSLRVEGGYWQFCTDANYRGDCRAFGPGDYPNLPDGFEHRISSVRRVAPPGR